VSSGSEGISGVWKARTGKKGVETMRTELDQCDPSSTLTISERLRDEQLMTKHNSRLLDGYYFRSVANDKL